MKNERKDILYMHVQASERFVISYGMSFQEFVYSLQHPLSNLLLLKHQFEDGEFNRNTLLDYVPSDSVMNLLKEDVSEYGDFCWVDFEEEAALDDIEDKELAELLFLGHTKSHLRQPFFRKLNNHFAYLSHDDGWFNKTYYRSLDTYYKMLGNLLSIKLESLRVERTWLGIRKKSEYPQVPLEVFESLEPLMGEGIAISLIGVQQSRNRIEIPIWTVGDYLNMDDMIEAYNEAKNDSAHALVVFNRKTKEWSVVLKKQ
ncbi:hypothetical protein ACN6MY_03280 [Peribacillus sp. B-H-3]|uniref:hypothetical protein n=1 Tax=Peribacillus sp. B-H-3 TaxID=3400420 RepID=UPI003B023AB1